MTRIFITLAAVGLATAGCGSEPAADQTAAADGTATADASGGVASDGAIAVLEREGWKVLNVDEQQASAAPADGSAG
jgi:uncharacterized spore protein YtfJ